MQFEQKTNEEEHQSSFPNDGNPQNLTPESPETTKGDCSYPEPDESSRVEPTASWNSNNQGAYRAQSQWPWQPNQKETQDMRRARNCATAGMILAIVSLILGGVFLSTIAIIFGIVGYVTAKPYLKEAHTQTQEAWKQILRSVRMALIFGVCALVLNAISMVYLYPMMLDYLQANGLSGFLSGSGSAGGSSSGSSVWG